ncbi:btb/poz domain-containing protein [Anaeramoeba flamelloides]|uniref:Btb/poz domain-containing protein n=1 Tax=Anaeramoeba flamelloides TaxID=1746091 RepID=A0AAV7ZRC3_9EUKA|nr:btb/poz domain-containing protein [Anaeramoeba flamelloides]
MSLQHFQSVISTYKFGSELSDVIFLIGHNQKKYPSHRLVFSVTSPFWESLFYPKNWRSLREEQSVVTLKDVLPTTWDVINEFVYHNTTRSLNKRNLVDVIELAKTFQMVKLLQICISFQIRHYSLDELLLKLKQIDNGIENENEMIHEFFEEKQNENEKKIQKQKKNEKKKGGNFQKTNSTNNTNIGNDNENGNVKEKENKKENQVQSEKPKEKERDLDQEQENNNQIEIENGNLPNTNQAEYEKVTEKEKGKETEKEREKEKEKEKENSNRNFQNIRHTTNSIRRKEILKCAQNNLFDLLKIEKCLITLTKETLLELFSNNSLDIVPPILFFRRIIERGKHFAIQFDSANRKSLIMDYIREFLPLVDLSKCDLSQLLEIKSSVLIDQSTINQRLNGLIEKKKTNHQGQMLVTDTSFFPQTFEENYLTIKSDRREISQIDNFFKQFKEEEKQPQKENKHEVKPKIKRKKKKKKLILIKKVKAKKTKKSNIQKPQRKEKEKTSTGNKRNVLSHKYQFRNKKKKNYNLDNLSNFYNNNEITNLYHKKKERKKQKAKYNFRDQTNMKKNERQREREKERKRKEKREKKKKKKERKKKEKEDKIMANVDINYKVKMGKLYLSNTFENIRRSFTDSQLKEPRDVNVLFITSENNKQRRRDICQSIKTLGIRKVTTWKNTTPKYELFQKFDVVVVMIQSYSNFKNLELLSNMLGKYVEDGGGVVFSTFKSIIKNSNQNSNTFLFGKFATTYFPITPSKQLIKSPANLGMVLYPDHPIMQGVESFHGGDLATRVKTNLIKIEENTDNPQILYTIANWDDGNPLISVRKVGYYGRVVSLNFSLPSGYAYSKPTQRLYWDNATDGGKIIANSVRWAARL